MDWQGCLAQLKLEDFKGSAWRIIETQSKSFTRKFVENAKEHDLLEKLLDGSKPPLKYYNDESAFKGLHYLLFTPFRYPPLMYGSRFGTKFERNLFYSALELKTAMAEKAYYRLAFLLGTSANLGGKHVDCTAFNFSIHTSKFVDVTKSPFDAFHEKITATHYQFSQSLGQSLREKGIEAFLSESARCPQKGKNLNIFTPSVFVKNKNIDVTFQHFRCFYSHQGIEFFNQNSPLSKPVIFPVQTFFVAGKFPFPPI